MTDHMLYMDFSPERGWSAPEIKPYGPLNLDPACSCFHYCPNVFEGLKVRRTLRPHSLTDGPQSHPNAIAPHTGRHIEGQMVPRVYSGRS
jgi:hypothetical protein